MLSYMYEENILSAAILSSFFTVHMTICTVHDKNCFSNVVLCRVYRTDFFNTTIYLYFQSSIYTANLIKVSHITVKYYCKTYCEILGKNGMYTKCKYLCQMCV